MSPDLGKLQSFYEKHRLCKMKKNMYIQDQGVKNEEFFIAAVFSDLFSCSTIFTKVRGTFTTPCVLKTLHNNAAGLDVGLIDLSVIH